MKFQEYIKPELLILIPVLFLIGLAIKKSALSDKFIPFILGGIGIVLSALYLVATTTMSGTQEIATAMFTAITQGILVAGASVYADQLIKQAKKED